MQSGLYIVGTPIGNLEDITYRAIEVLKSVNRIVAEDTRISRRLLTRFDIHKPLMSCHKFNEAARIDGILDLIRQGESVALVSDSGMPSVSDPGSRLVRACRDEGLFVTVIPGPSAVTSAMALSGIETPSFLFGGFLPQKPGKKRRALIGFLKTGLPVVLFESPYRLVKLLTLIQELDEQAFVFVGRELTKKFEELHAGSPAGILSAYADRNVKGELVLVVQVSNPEVLNAPAEAATE